MLFDFSDSEWHFGLDGAVEMANAYPDTPLLLYHWGSVDAPDFPPFNGDPATLYRPGHQPRPDPGAGPGEPYRLTRLGGEGLTARSGGAQVGAIGRQARSAVRRVPPAGRG